MLIDFSVISSILNKYIHDIVDHAFLVYSGDAVMLDSLQSLGDEHRTVVLPFIPTAENLAKWAFEQVSPHISTEYGNQIRLVAMHVRETPKSWASWRVD
jgi:6-pyruvoyltetrahydropterin/6-carboxytetrahydropterin synthase